MIKKFYLDPIITEGKPGALINLNINEICSKNDITFNPNHIFYLNDLNSIEARGNHSNSNAKEMLFCLQGNFDIYLLDGTVEHSYNIKQNELIFIPNNVWIEINNFKNCVILAYVEIFTEKKKSIYSLEEYKNLNN